LYPVLLFILLALLAFNLAGRADVDVTVLRVRSTPYHVLENGEVSNIVKLKVTNRTDGAKRYTLQLDGDGRLHPADLALDVPAGEAIPLDVEVVLPRARFVNGRATVRLSVLDRDQDGDAAAAVEHVVLGPLFGAGDDPGGQR
jgi:hypothetical protein